MNTPWVDKAHIQGQPPRPAFESIPVCLDPWFHLKVWVLWDWVPVGERLTKPPLQANGSRASVNNERTWCTGNDALRYANDRNKGIGLVLTNIAGLVAIDLDDARTQNGHVAPWAAELIERANSYTEVSPSGGGFRIFGRTTGKDPISFNVKDGVKKFEVYSHTQRYVTVTGLRHGSVSDLADLTDLVASLRPPHAERPSPAASELYEPVDEAAYEARVRTLKPQVLERAEGPSADRSADFQSVTNTLRLKGFNPSEALQFWIDRPDGPAAKYIEGGRLEEELERSWSKARAPDDGTPPSTWNAGPTTRPRIELVPWSQLNFDLDGDEFLVEGLIPREGLSVVYGPPKSYKSFIVGDMALAVARDQQWGGRDVLQGPVVYVAGEGAAGLIKRLTAYRTAQRLEADNLPFFLASARLNLGTAVGDTEELVAAVQSAIGGEQPVLIVIDTLARMLAGQSENAEGMFNFVNNAEALSSKLGCAVLAVHHEGKNSDAGMRGSSNLHGAVVAAIRVRRDGDYKAVLTVEDAKDADDDVEVRVDLEKYELGRNRKGRVVSTLLVKSVSVGGKRNSQARPAGKEPKAPPTMTALMRAFEDVVLDQPETAEVELGAPQVVCAPLAGIKKRFLELWDDGTAAPDSRRRAFDRHMKGALDRQILRVASVDGRRLVWRP